MLSRLYFSAISKYYSPKNGSEHTRDYKRLLPVCEPEILRVTVKELKFSHLMLISDDFRLKVPKIAKKGT